MTGSTVLWRRSDPRLFVVTSGTIAVGSRCCFEGALLQPERVFGQVLRRRGNKLVTRLSLGLVGVMAYDATLRLRIIPRVRCMSKSECPIIAKSETQATHHVHVFLMWKRNLELRNEIRTRAQEWCAQTWKWMPRGVFWSNRNVTVRTDDRRRPFTREELCAMTVETGLVFGKVSHVGERIVALTNFFPVFRGKLMARITGKLLRLDVSVVRKSRVVDARLLWLTLSWPRTTTRLSDYRRIVRVDETAEAEQENETR